MEVPNRLTLYVIAPPITTTPADIDNDDGNNNEDDDVELVESSLAARPHKRKRTGCNIEAQISNTKDVSDSSGTQQFLQRRPEISRTMHPLREMGPCILKFLKLSNL